MCGIFGLIQSTPFSTEELAKMSRLMRHRGPDDEGVVLLGRDGAVVYGGPDTPSSSYDNQVPYCPRQRLPAEGPIGHGGVALGHRRLSILDLSAHGHQPMSYRNRYWISYNGEVFNYIELRTELQAAGYEFTSGSDTEVIVAAFDRWGADCLSRFNGMWAMAIVDVAERRLFLARDRFGIKPLYLFDDGRRLAFASELKAFSTLQGWKARADRQQLLDFLVWNVSDHTQRTTFDGVTQLPAGHYLSIDLSSLAPSGLPPDRPGAKRWYHLPESGPHPSSKEAMRRLSELLEDAVRLRLRSDVPVGSCLSGGLDSSTIVCLMAEQLRSSTHPSEVQTFTARSHDSDFDEFNFAEAVIERANASARTVVPTPARLFEQLDTLTWHQDEPFMTTSIFAQWCVFQRAKESNVTVMLDGQGADETLGGYRSFFGPHLANLVRTGQLHRWLGELVAMRREIGFSPVRSVGYTLAYLWPRFVRSVGRFDQRAYANQDWIRPSAREAARIDPLLSAGGRASSVRAMSVAQITTTNLPMLLHWEDRNSMAHSIEARVPFLDYRVVEHCLSIADSDKLGGGVSKRILRDCMRGRVPDLVLDRRDKMGFVTAERLWVTRDLTSTFRSDLAKAVETLGAVVSPKLLEQFDDVVRGARPFDHRYWRAISASRWASVFGVTV